MALLELFLACLPTMYNLGDPPTHTHLVGVKHARLAKRLVRGVSTKCNATQVATHD
jgi:hypothetical protein